MNIYTAIMMAAEHIERRPDEFDFDSLVVPARPGCGTPGCAIGWIIHFFGAERRTVIGNFTRTHMGLESDSVFYRRINAFAEYGDADWHYNSHQCARLLRLYAEKYHAPVIAPPNWRAIMASPLIPEHVQSEDAAHV